MATSTFLQPNALLTGDYLYEINRLKSEKTNKMSCDNVRMAIEANSKSHNDITT